MVCDFEQVLAAHWNVIIHTYVHDAIAQTDVKEVTLAIYVCTCLGEETVPKH